MNSSKARLLAGLFAYRKAALWGESGERQATDGLPASNESPAVRQSAYSAASTSAGNVKGRQALPGLPAGKKEDGAKSHRGGVHISPFTL